MMTAETAEHYGILLGLLKEPFPTSTLRGSIFSLSGF